MMYEQQLTNSLLPKWGERVVRSIMLNFRDEGRPNKWRPSKRASKRSKGRLGKTLSHTGVLKNSVHYMIAGNKLTVGTNVIYAAAQQFGHHFNKTVDVKGHQRKQRQVFGHKLSTAITVFVRSHKMTMDTTLPARPFFLIQDTDRKYFENSALTELSKILARGL